ncbi:MAG: lysophospholipid acyltransferase family protein [Deltaproteobacteria bacterium]|nr:lysophospholipid acyltransferase family protein [Deltaproteobacteria bacterium]
MSERYLKNRLDERWPIWAAKALRLVSRLVRTKAIGIEQTTRGPCGIAHWHGDELALIPRFGHIRPTILVSHSKDGAIMAKGATALGYRVTRGSSTRGAVGGLLALIKAVKGGHAVVLAVDGPQGPRGVCKPGIIRVVQKAGVPLFPVGVAGSNRFVFKKSWNQAYLPLPFSRQVVWIDKPLYFPKKSEASEIPGYCRQVERAIGDAQKKAEALLLKG